MTSSGESSYKPTLNDLVNESNREFTEKKLSKSLAFYQERAKDVLPGGVGSGYFGRYPTPIYFESCGRCISNGNNGSSSLVDLDGNGYVDFAFNLGASIAGHCHPAIAKALEQAVTQTGCMLGGGSSKSVEVAEELNRRFLLNSTHHHHEEKADDKQQTPFFGMWRFMNSGTEATRDAIQIARSYTSRKKIIKFECGYHGVHESVACSFWNPEEQLGKDTNTPANPSSHLGIPDEFTNLTMVCQYNCSEESFRNRFQSSSTASTADDGRSKNEVACVIVEPYMMNCGIIPPREGFLEMLRRVCNETGALLIFDEVKTGLTVSPGSAAREVATGQGDCHRQGNGDCEAVIAPPIIPDLVCLGKALGGGTVPVAAVGIFDEKVGAAINRGEAYSPVSTTGGSLIAMTVAHAVLSEVLTDEAYERMRRLNDRLATGLREAVKAAGPTLPLQPIIVTAGCAKGSIFFFRKETKRKKKKKTGVVGDDLSNRKEDDDCPHEDDTATPPTNYREVLQLHKKYHQAEVAELCAVRMALDGVWVGATGDEEWTISAATTEQDVDAFVRAFTNFLRYYNEKEAPL